MDKTTLRTSPTTQGNKKDRDRRPVLDPCSKPPLELLKHHGLRVTATRIAVVAELQKQPRRFMHPEDVFRAWIADDAASSISSAYRVLAELAQAGLVRRARNTQGKAMYRLATDLPMQYLPRLIREDGDEILLNDPGLRELIDQAALVHGVDISASRLVLHIHPLSTADIAVCGSR